MGRPYTTPRTVAFRQNLVPLRKYHTRAAHEMRGEGALVAMYVPSPP
jgi:hypothetical protein